MDYLKLLRGSLDLDNLIGSVKYNRLFRKEHPEYFDPDGILVFCGPQGSGKTLSAVQYVIHLAKKYPAMMLVTNVSISREVLGDIQVFPYTGLHDLSKYNNGFAGVCFLIDEIQIEFNSLESRNIDPVVITEIAQQRKQRKHIVGTSQVFGRIAKPFREQFKYAVFCKNVCHYLQLNTLVRGEDCSVDDEGHITTEHVRRFVWLHDPSVYKCYDTYAKIIRTNTVGYKGR